MESPVSFDCWLNRGTDENLGDQGDGTSAVTITSSSHDHVTSQQPVSDAAEKRRRKPRDFWTHQEEGSFFTAFGQVGKDFKKIAHIVQTKKLNQVRDYYYRFLGRMNKLFSSEVYFDSKDSKTDAAMFDWWTLLEKHNFKGAKLHLKPRKKEIFLHNLKQQFLMDRVEDIKKRHAQREVCSTTATEIASSQGKALVNDRQAVKEVLLFGQNIQEPGSGKGSLLKSNPNTDVNCSNCKGDTTSTAAYKRLKEAATAGVSLIFDVAEHLERTALDETNEPGKGENCVDPTRNVVPSSATSLLTGDTTSTAEYKRLEEAAKAGISLIADAAENLERTALDETNELGKGENCVDPTGNVVPSSATSSQNLCVDKSAQISLKLKLKLFPIDEITRGALETDDHNPHLELTLSARKKISSVLEHLNRKWGKSSIACGELLLLPYRVKKENLINCQRWTQDSVLSVADVFKEIGSPSVFRLRYCWLSSDRHELSACQAPEQLPGIFSKQVTEINNTDHQDVNEVRDFTPVHVPYIWPSWKN